jgi:hypothetical protein
MGLMDILNGMQNGARGAPQGGPASRSGGGMSPTMMALLGLLAYKAIKGGGLEKMLRGSPAQSPTNPGSSSGRPGGGLGGMLGGAGQSPGGSGGPGSVIGSVLGGLLGGGAAGSVRSMAACAI